MSSCVITWIAEAVCDNRSGRFETEVTCRFINCSMLSFFKESADTADSGCWASPRGVKQTRPNVKTIAVAAATVFMSAIARSPPFLWLSGIPAQHALPAQRRGDLSHGPQPRVTTWRFARRVPGGFFGTDGGVPAPGGGPPNGGPPATHLLQRRDTTPRV